MLDAHSAQMRSLSPERAAAQLGKVTIFTVPGPGWW